MAIQKVTPNYLKHAEFPHPYTPIINSTIDLIPTDCALGVYVYLARKPHDWIIQEKDIMARFKRGRDHVRKCLATLKEVGLLEKTAYRDEKGHILRWETTLFRHIPEKPSSGQEENPAPVAASDHITENPSSGSIHITENPTSGKTHLLDNPTHTKERSLQNKEGLQKKEISSSQFVISETSDEWVLRVKRESGDTREDDDLLMQVKFRIDNRDQAKHTETQTLRSTIKWISQGCFDVPAGYINPKEEARKKEEQERRLEAQKEAQDRQHEEYLRGLKERRTSTPNKPAVSIMEMVKQYKPQTA